MTTFDVFTLARTIWGEARGEPMAGKLAVGWVARNRLAARRWFSAAGLAEVCQKPSQFACWTMGDPDRPKLLRLTLDDADFQDCMYAALAVMRGHAPDPTDGATHYHAAALPPPDWAAGHVPCAAIGGHLFYRGVA